MFRIIKSGLKPGTNGLPDAILTIFGWVIGGDANQLTNSGSTPCLASLHSSLDIDFDLQRFWDLEEINPENPLSVEEQQAETHYASTHTRSQDGKYVVKLPFKTNTPVDYGDSFTGAIQRLYSTERRFKENQSLKLEYSKFMSEYLSLGHMVEIPQSEVAVDTFNSYYLPHHPVFKKDSSTTKLRVVFDGTSRGKATTSLNENLLIGPPVQRDLFAVCLRFRRHIYTMSGDIEKMFRQIWVSSEDQDFQRIVWRDCPTDTIKHFRLKTVTYGTSCAPYLSVRTLRQLAFDSLKTFPKSAEIILNDFYVDDVMTGADTVDDLIQLHSELVQLLQSSGFNLRKWSTNCWPLLVSLPEEMREHSPIEFEHSTSVKVLGLKWNPSKDCFSYKVTLPENHVCTKRQILSDSSRIFDPLGFLSPAVISLKILFQELWLLNLNWDDKIPSEIALRWLSLRSELSQLDQIEIPRYLGHMNSSIEYHGFCDASLKAYSAVIYCRTSDSLGNNQVTIVAAKTKVAPLKVISLPRLELCGGVLLCRLINKIKASFQIGDLKIFAWTDSQILLHWLSSPPRRWSVFVSNRTSEILSSVQRTSWFHVPSTMNPADCASRGISPSSLVEHELWWYGPSWLKDTSENWPITTNAPTPDGYIIGVQEERTSSKSSLQLLHTSVPDSHSLSQLILRRSHWKFIVRSIAYCNRFISHARLSNPERSNSIALCPTEIENATIILLKWVQHSSFAADIFELQNHSKLTNKSKLLSLMPFLDEQGLLRVGGRIHQSDLPYSTRHPIILPKNETASRLIIRYTHEANLHVGASQLFSLLRESYWIIGSRNMIRKIIHDCVVCFRHRKASITSQIMGNLPQSRVTYSRPFSKVGCDYAGPITLRLRRGKKPTFVKGYIALFVCLSTKALHLELVNDLSSNSFLAALDRFAARRGKPIEILSDNGTNFKGASRILNEMYEVLLSEQHQNMVIDHLSKDKIIWKFIPPVSPHFGGLWEAGVKTVKTHIKRVIGEQILTYEEMYTLLTRIEALLNSRPLYATSDTDPTALTPAHFLIGQSYTSVPEADLTNTNFSLISNWQKIQHLTQGFWKRWHAEYLTSLQQRPKWRQQQPDLQPGDIVLLKEPKLPQAKWILARVKLVHPGADSRVRVVTVETPHGIFTRPITKLVQLPFAERT